MLLIEVERHNVNKTFERVIAVNGWKRTEGPDFEEAIFSLVHLTKFEYYLLHQQPLPNFEKRD